MKKKIFILAVSFIATTTFSQDKEVKNIEFNKEQFLKEISENACKCIDSIETFDRTKENIAEDISQCIDKQVGTYQMGLKIAELNIKELEKEAKTNNNKKDIDINININPNSKEYKEYYYKLERYLTDNCSALKSKVNSNDKLGAKSLSRNDLALDYYNKGIAASKKENLEEAISYYKKAVTVDPEFAFAYDNMGISYRKLNKFDEAIEAYEKSLKIDPNGSMPLQNIAVAYTYKKEYKKAVKAYEKLGKVQPDNPEVFFGIGSIYTQYLNDIEKGLDNMCKAYLMYIAIKSPYRTDAEKYIQVLYNEFEKQEKLDTFNKILEKHNIKTN